MVFYFISMFSFPLGTKKLTGEMWVPATEGMSQETTSNTHSRIGILQGSWGSSGIKSMLLLRDKSLGNLYGREL